MISSGFGLTKGPLWTITGLVSVLLGIDELESDDLDDGTGVDARGVLAGVGEWLRPGSSGARIGLPFRIGTMRNSNCAGQYCQIYHV